MGDDNFTSWQDLQKLLLSYLISSSIWFHYFFTCLNQWSGYHHYNFFDLRLSMIWFFSLLEIWSLFIWYRSFSIYSIMLQSANWEIRDRIPKLRWIKISESRKYPWMIESMKNCLHSFLTSSSSWFNRFLFTRVTQCSDHHHRFCNLRKSMFCIFFFFVKLDLTILSKFTYHISFIDDDISFSWIESYKWHL